jgi:hypothetical protein
LSPKNRNGGRRRKRRKKRVRDIIVTVLKEGRNRIYYFGRETGFLSIYLFEEEGGPVVAVDDVDGGLYITIECH